MKLKTALLVGLMSVSLAGCTQKATVPKSPVGEEHYGIEDVERLLSSKDIQLTGAEQLDVNWTLNQRIPTTYYYSCSRLTECMKPSEHLTVYTYKNAAERQKGYDEFLSKQNELVQAFSTHRLNPLASTAALSYPLVWQQANALVVYWHQAESGRKPVMAEQIGSALVGWQKASGPFFDEAAAVDLVLAERPEFPKAGVVKPIETGTGGPAPGARLRGELTTAVGLSTNKDKDSYLVTLTKKWNVTVNGKEAKSFWIYEVTPDKVELLSSVEQADMVERMK